MSKSANLRNFTFGVEDSLASTVGLLSGIASAQIRPSTIVLTGLVLIITEALSMGIGSFLSDQSARQLLRHGQVSARSSISGAVVMFVSYLVSGLIPVFPYTVFAPPLAIYLSIFLSLISLFALGVINALLAHVSPLSTGLRMLVLGGCVAVSGVLIGGLLKDAGF